MRTGLIQFLMGLNDGYEVVKSQILLLDPFPTINKAYDMIQRVEKQREINLEPQIDVANFSNRFQAKNTYANDKAPNIFARRDKRDTRKCTHCGGTRHTKEICFEVIGYPE